MVTPYDMGWNAGYKGTVYTNPFQLDSANYNSFLEGYQDGREEREYVDNNPKSLEDIKERNDQSNSLGR